MLLHSALPVSPWAHRPSLLWGFPKRSKFTGKHRNSEELLTLEGEGKGISTTYSLIYLKDVLPWPPRDHLPGLSPRLPSLPPSFATSFLHTLQKSSSLYYIEQACGHFLILNIPTSPFLPSQNIFSAWQKALPEMASGEFHFLWLIMFGSRQINRMLQWAPRSVLLPTPL